MPHLLQLQESRSQDTVAITLDVDFDGGTDVDAQLMRRVAAKLSARVPAVRSPGHRHWMSSDPTSAVLEKYGAFALPAVLIFDREGKLAKRFEGKFTYEKDVIPFVHALVGSKP
ncbi:MAG: hypothetical protein KDC38_07370 [Planctomycetes bacterium]|nr:hypothetical protein [Planctomycetota bacterium]